MFRFAYANMNSVSTAAAARAEGVSSCAAANTNGTMMNFAMDAALAASISVILSIGLIGIISIRVLALSLLGLIIILPHTALGERSHA